MASGADLRNTEEDDTLPMGMEDYEEDYSWMEEDSFGEETDYPTNNDNDSVELVFEGIKVMFPKAPYPSQVEMMTSIMEGVKNSQHCLLESPTGTGKTLALLCSLLAWQNCYVKQLEVTKEKLEEKRRKPWETTQVNKSQNGSSSPKKSKPSESDDKKDNGEDKSTDFTIENVERAIRNVPVIYYATRTHAQISGVINQLKQTKYADVPMSILASRKHICLNEEALNYKDGVDAACQKLVKEKESLTGEKSRQNDVSDVVDGEEVQVPDIEDIGSSISLCKYFKEGMQHEMSNFPIEKDGCKNKPWLLEDLKRWGQVESRCRCPYYELKILKKEARIIFATYHHLLNPDVRLACQIFLRNNVLIFDEAHNIESVCCDVASTKGSLSLGKVEKAVKRLDEAMMKQSIPSRKMEPLRNLTLVMKRLADFLRAEARRLDPQDKLLSSFWGKTQEYRRSLPEDTIVTMLSRIQLGPDDLEDIWKDFIILQDRAHDDPDPPTDEERAFKVGKDGMKIIRNILCKLKMFFKRDCNDQEQVNFLYLNDYDKSFTITRHYGDSPTKSAMSFQPSPKTGTQSEATYDIQLELLCLNPAVVFEKIKRARTIIVTSGTLSPISSFASELNTEFKFTLQASHTVERHRLYSCIVTKHSNNWNLMNFSHKNRTNPDVFKDQQRQLFEIIRYMGNVIPNGLLVFAPSKGAMTRFKDEWARNGYLNQLRKVKPLYFEHEAADALTFSKMIKEYKIHARDSGAILFAIIRGRASEGEDFKDEEARGVITIGIPFSPCKDEGIQAKKDFNDMKKETNPNYLSGEEWYHICAFRAINQALGRCLRHQKDWGIICIVESRFQRREFVSYLSRWVQASLRNVQPGSLEIHGPKMVAFVDKAEALNHAALTQLALPQL